jgi:hypothetical protein
MLPVEQIFLQVRSQVGNKIADVAAATETICRADLNEVIDWFSAAENEIVLRCDPISIFFHPLPSGNFALGVIYPAQRSFLAFLQPPKNFNVRVLIIPPQTLLEKANHPIALFEEFRQRHLIPLISQAPKQILPITPLAVLPPIDRTQHESLAHRLGAMAIAQLVQSLFNAECTLFTSRPIDSLSVLSVIFDLLPMRYRTELTFSTDIFFSSRTSFRLMGCGSHWAVRYAKNLGLPMMVLDRKHTGAVETLDPWSRFVYQFFQGEHFNFLEACQKSEHRSLLMLKPEVSQPILWENLNEIGVAWSRDLLSGSLPGETVSAVDPPAHSLEELRCMAAVDQLLPMLNRAEPSGITPLPERRLADRFPQFGEKISELESYLTRCLFGDEDILSTIKRIWSSLEPQLDVTTKEIIQAEYVALIRAVLISSDNDSGRRLLRSSQLLELMLIFAA